jgi:hypothetical protein
MTMNIQQIACPECSGIVTDIFSIKKHDLIGTYFVCEFCGAVNVIGMTDTRRATIERITDEPFPVVLTTEQLSSWDATLQPNALLSLGVEPTTTSASFVVTSWADPIGNYEYIASLSEPTIVVDVSGRYDPVRPADETYTINAGKDIQRICTAVVAILGEYDRFSTVVITDWNDVHDSVDEYIRTINGQRAMMVDDFVMRNDIIDWLLGKLRALQDDGVAIETFHRNTSEARKPLDPTECIPRYLMYYATQVNLMENGAKTVVPIDV